jgi:signal transduction histidine kinase
MDDSNRSATPPTAQPGAALETVRAEMAKPPPGLLTRLLALEVPLTLLEGLVVIVPLDTFFPSLPAGVMPAGVGVLASLWAIAMWRSMRPLLAGVRPHRFVAAYRLGHRLATGGLLLRFALWVALSVSVAMLTPRGVPRSQLGTFLAVCLVHSLCVSLIRWALQNHIFQSAVTRMGLDPSWRQFQADTLLSRLVEVTLLLGAITAGFLAVFVFCFVPISVEQYMFLEASFPWVGVMLAAVWYFGVAPRQVAPLLAYLRSDERNAEASRGLLLRASSAAHRLPSRLALVKLVFFSTAGLLLSAETVLLCGFTVLQGALICGAVFIVTLGTAVYEMTWSRAVLRPIVAHLMSQPGADQLEVQAPSLRRKLLLSFGGVLVFTVALPLFWTFLQFGNLREDLAVAQANREMHTLLRRLRLEQSDVTERLSRVQPVDGSRYLFVPHTGPVSPSLSAGLVRDIRHQERGAVSLPGARLAGIYQRIDPSRPESGSVVALLPLPASAKVTLSFPGVILFFATILAIAVGVVFLTSADLTRPLAVLEHRAAEMAQGKLDQRMLPGGEFDEIGRLTLAFETMRRALQGKIRTIEKLNLGLEEKVRERTTELERANAELLSTIEALQEAQHRLVLSEKMASVGQLVAGIAHEINNPINAVVNTVAPLAETVRRLSAGTLLDAADRSEAEEDLEAMLRVIQSGTQRTQRIVQALRSYSRKDAEALARVDLHTDIEETLALLTHGLRGIEVKRDFEAKSEIRAYRGQLNQALVNLISNAAAALEGRSDGEIVIRTRDKADSVLLEVQDNGPGIPAEVLPKIFDPFFTTKEVGKGTGLGLSITHRIVEHHGGHIGVQTSSAGTTFTVEIPREGPRTDQ